MLNYRRVARRRTTYFSLFCVRAERINHRCGATYLCAGQLCCCQCVFGWTGPLAGCTWSSCSLHSVVGQPGEFPTWHPWSRPGGVDKLMMAMIASVVSRKSTTFQVDVYPSNILLRHELNSCRQDSRSNKSMAQSRETCINSYSIVPGYPWVKGEKEPPRGEIYDPGIYQDDFELSGRFITFF